MDKCPYCGSTKGAMTTFIGTQYYKWNGEPDGYFEEMDGSESKFAKCLDCGRKIKLAKLQRNYLFGKD